VNGKHNVTAIDLGGQTDLCFKRAFHSVSINCHEDDVGRMDFDKESCNGEKPFSSGRTRSIFPSLITLVFSLAFFCQGGWEEPLEVDFQDTSSMDYYGQYDGRGGGYSGRPRRQALDSFGGANQYDVSHNIDVRPDDGLSFLSSPTVEG